MLLRTMRDCVVLFILIFAGALAMHAQAVAEYGAAMGNSAGVTAAVKPPAPNLGLPETAANAGSGAALNSPGVPGGNAESAAQTNKQFFQSQSGPNAAQVAVHTVPDHAQAWIDGKFVGPTPLDLKLAPGHHQVLVRAPNMQEVVRDFDLTAKQTQAIDLAMKSSYQNQVIIHWPSQK
ncbi:MAG TPA: PEGA domain-containing protein [Verrucomicrobiae bacterium]|nr:PEGA domain-containing protein [Verrucomicrobiae bacterium]